MFEEIDMIILPQSIRNVVGSNENYIPKYLEFDQISFGKSIYRSIDNYVIYRRVLGIYEYCLIDNPVDKLNDTPYNLVSDYIIMDESKIHKIVKERFRIFIMHDLSFKVRENEVFV